jgi:membrane-associated phospholipid phosphatase
MKKLWALCATCFCVFASVCAQQDSAKVDTTIVTRDTTPIMQPQPMENEKPIPVYKINPAVDVPITAVGTLWSLYAFTKIYNKDESSDEQILALQKSDVNGFDRWAIRPYDKQIDRISYIPFYLAMPMPVAFLFDKKMRKDFAKLSFMYLETMSITGLLYTGSTYLTDRYRPYTYDEGTEFNQKTRGGAKNSFYAGHVALVATSTFFFAQVYADYHPDSKIKWLFYTIAGAATGGTAYLRHLGGQHFPSDLLLGMTQGTLTGLLVPKLHKTKLFKDQTLSIIPFMGPTKGLAVVYKFK